MNDKQLLLRPRLANKTGPIIFYDKARQHVSLMILRNFKENGYSVLPHQSDSPDNSPTYYHFSSTTGVGVQKLNTAGSAFKDFITSRTNVFCHQESKFLPYNREMNTLTIKPCAFTPLIKLMINYVLIVTTPFSI